MQWQYRLIDLAIVMLVVSATAGMAQDVANGEDVFKKCRACHEVGPDAKNKIGPMLRGICDRTAGTSPGFGYSDAMKDAGGKGLKWTDEALAKYLTDPRGSLPGNKMAFPGIKDEADLKDLIAYLRKAAR